MTLAKHGKALNREEFERIGKISFPKAPRPDLSVRRLLKSPLIKKMAEKRIDEILEEHGVTMGSILDRYDEAYELAGER